MIYVLLTIYFSKYLQFPLNIITDCQNHVTEHVFLEDNDPWKCKFFIFAIFIFSILEGFSETTYKKTCRFYNVFSKSTSNCTCLQSFTIWICFSKIWWPFQFNVYFFRFPPLLPDNLWKDVLILWLIFKLSIIMCRLTKFFQVKCLLKKWRLFGNVNNLSLISATLRNICDKTSEKTYLFFHILGLPLWFYMFTNFRDQ